MACKDGNHPHDEVDNLAAEVRELPGGSVDLRGRDDTTLNMRVKTSSLETLRAVMAGLVAIDERFSAGDCKFSLRANMDILARGHNERPKPQWLECVERHFAGRKGRGELTLKDVFEAGLAQGAAECRQGADCELDMRLSALETTLDGLAEDVSNLRTAALSRLEKLEAGAGQ